MKLPCTQIGKMQVFPMDDGDSSRPAAPPPSTTEEIRDPLRGGGGYYHPALHVTDLTIPVEEPPKLLPFQTKESAYPAQKLVERVTFLKIYADNIESDFTLVRSAKQNVESQRRHKSLSLCLLLKFESYSLCPL